MVVIITTTNEYSEILAILEDKTKQKTFKKQENNPMWELETYHPRPLVQSREEATH